MAKLLLVDDDPALLRVLTEYLRRFDYEIQTAADGAEAIEAAKTNEPDLIVLDVNMPLMDGLQALRTLRRDTSVPVIMVTAQAGESDVLQGFTLGADDYVSKPFSFAQLEARIRAVLARSRRGSAGTAGRKIVLAQGDLVVELDAHKVRRGDDVIKLTPTEFRLLVALMEQPGRIMPPEELVTKVWGSQYAGQVDYVRRYVWYLRQKLEEDPEVPRYIKNERNVGYYFDADVTAQL